MKKHDRLLHCAAHPAQTEQHFSLLQIFASRRRHTHLVDYMA